MNVPLMIEEVIDAVILRHQHEKGEIPQISSYMGNIVLKGFLSFDLTIGVHAHDPHYHILLVRNSIEEIKEDYSSGVKKIVPFCIFTIKHKDGERTLRLSSGNLDRIELSGLTYDEMAIYLDLQKILYQKIK